MKIAIIGLGGVGGYVGYHLLSAFKENRDVRIDFVARGTHGAAIREHGLALSSNGVTLDPVMPDRVLPKLPAETYDLILICVKSYDLADVLEDLQVPYLKGTVIIPLMNGVENARIVSNRLNESVVLPACVYVASHVKGPGVIEHKGADGRIICGIDEQTNYDYSRISNFLSQSPVSFELLPDASIPIWKKFLFIASFGLMTSRFNITFGELCASQSYKERAQAIAGEILEIAIANGVNLETSEARRIFDVAGAFPSATRSSLQLDIHSGKDKNELDLFTDPIIRFGRAVGIRAREVESIRAEILALNQRSVL